ncbi:DNA-directed DNA polymerase II small subunit [Candidatus Woesearchaeota archaeon]|nr:DNA-directed DNA polymerase II small subunit [Candidatus Woesearchaeota archaeon]
MNKQEIINYFLEKGVLISPDFFNEFDEKFNSLDFHKILTKKSLSTPLVLNKELCNFVYSGGFLDFNWNDFDRSKVLSEKEINFSSYSVFEQIMFKNFKEEENKGGEILLQQIKQEPEKISVDTKEESKVEILFSYKDNNKKREVNDFVKFFRNRYETIKKILCSRQELKDSVSIARLKRKNEREAVTIIGVVLDKAITKNENIKLVLEDTTDTFNVLITKNREDLYNLAKDLVLDEVIGISGVMGNNILFCNGIYLPDIPITNELKKCPDEVYAVFISDVHFGIKNFLHDDFMNFVNWLNGKHGTEQQKDIANKVKYLFVTGDVVEGVGIYPGQEEDLEIKDIYEQYELATKYLKLIPQNIKIIICGGNHDAMRIAEPQPIFDREIAKGFYEMPNVILVSNPAMVNIHSKEGFPGFNILMYHGFSFPYYGDNVPSIREKGGIFRCDMIMKFLLQRRHLAPSHGSNLYIPDITQDPLVIEKVPDIFVSGHIHQSIVSNYRNVSLINSSCWVVQSEDNAKRGIVPNPAKIPILNLKTREVRIMNFLGDNAKVLVSERAGLK